MNILVTGTPGCGKTTLSKIIAKKFGMKLINEKDFATQNKIGIFNEDNELEIPIKELENKANIFLKQNKNIVFEGHVFCETKLKVDLVILITINPEVLQLRLEKRNYSAQKIMDNIFCEGISYCKKHIKKRYAKSKICEVISQPSPELTFLKVLPFIEKTSK